MRKILVIRSEGKFSELLRDAGFDVISLELIATKPIEDQSELRRMIATLADYDGLFFTSPAAAEVFVRERHGTNGYHGNVYALGSRAKAILENAGLKVHSLKAANTVSEMTSAFMSSEFAGKRFLFVRGDKSLGTIPERLGNLATVDEVVVYKTIEVEHADATIERVDERLKRGAFEWMCFFSPSGVDAFLKLFAVDTAPKIKAAVIGETTGKHAREKGLNVDFVSDHASEEHLAKGLIDFIRNGN